MASTCDQNLRMASILRYTARRASYHYSLNKLGYLFPQLSLKGHQRHHSLSSPVPTFSTQTHASIAPTSATSTSGSLTQGEHSSQPPVYLQSLSQEQVAAVTAPLGAVRVVAGPGSGKTRVLTSRIAHLIHHHNAKPWQIVAITFTNKAALEMRERLDSALGQTAANELFAGTFHSLCYRILRRAFSSLPPTVGRSENWNLYDQDASLSVIYKLVRAAKPEWKTKEAREYAKAIQSRISRVKNSQNCWDGISSTNGVGLRNANVIIKDAVDAFYAKMYQEDVIPPGAQGAADDLTDWFLLYEQAMKDANALDFDDLLGLTTTVLRGDPELRQRLQRRWRYLLVDEFQDTNTPQYDILKLLSGVGSNELANVFIVGDPDQAIYGWRGADVANMRYNFLSDFATSSVHRLRDNYRSTPTILQAAQSVIMRNSDVERQALRARRGDGPPITITAVQDAFEEADLIADTIKDLLRTGSTDSSGSSSFIRDRDIAVLFRTHQQARFIEQALVKAGLPYVLIGGVPFWRRVEIQDIMAYLRLGVTLDDDVALERVINVPKRGLGDVSIGKIRDRAEAVGLTLGRYLLFDSAEEGFAAGLARAMINNGTNDPKQASKQEKEFQKSLGLSTKAFNELQQFRADILSIRQALLTLPLQESLQAIIDTVNYEEHVKNGGCGGKDEQIEDRLVRLEQLLGAAAAFVPGQGAGAEALERAFDVLMDEEAVDRNEMKKKEKQRAERRLQWADTDQASGVQYIEQTTTDTSGIDTGNAKQSSSLDIARSFLDEAALYQGVEEDADVDGIRLMTMHAAKGLEFEVVVIPGCVEGLVPLYSQGDDEDDLEEETRLFFVSMTRAKKELKLIYTKMHVMHGSANRRPNEPSRYLKDVVKSGQGKVVEVGQSSMSRAAHPGSMLRRGTKRTERRSMSAGERYEAARRRVQKEREIGEESLAQRLARKRRERW